MCGGQCALKRDGSCALFPLIDDMMTLLRLLQQCTYVDYKYVFTIFGF